MAAKKVKCPKCQAVLALPDNVEAGTLRCPGCRCVFHIHGPSKPSLEDTIADWLNQSLEDEEPNRGPDRLAPARQTVEELPDLSELAGEVEEEAAPPPEPEKKRKRSGGLRLVAAERRGALFEFPAEFLRSEKFRCSIPHACVGCLARAHLSAHLIIYSSQLKDSISLEVEHQAGKLSIRQDKINKLEGPELLAMLPELPNAPPPANLPMPYWVCDMCTGSGSISGQIQVNSTTGKGRCRLYVRNLKLAKDFLSNNGAEGSEDYVHLQEFVEELEEDRWGALPSVVRHRVEQWFRPRKGERFVAYIPDRSFGRTEDGMNGLVISTKRLVYQRTPRHQESPVENELTIQVRLAEGKDVASIEAADFKKRAVTLDRAGMMLFRRALSKGRFRASWT